MKIMVKCDYLELWMQPELNNKNSAGIGMFIGQKCPKFRMFALPALFLVTRLLKQSMAYLVCHVYGCM